MKRLKNIIKATLTSALIVSCYSIVHSQNFAQSSTPTIPALTNSRAEWVDFNNDGLKDLFLAGTSTNGSPLVHVYIHDDQHSFNSVLLAPLLEIDVDFNDFNRDGFVDIAYIGMEASGTPRTHIYLNNNGQSFIQHDQELPGVSNGSVIWRDLDRDGDVDLFLTGINETDSPITDVFENVNGVYNVRASQLPALSNGESVAIDHGNDGTPEILLTGINVDGNFFSAIVSVDTALQFTTLPIEIPTTAFNSIATADFNSDGNMDVAINGLSGITSQPVTMVLLNQQPGGYTQLTNGLPQLSSGSVDAIDLNNDGQSDLILTGQDVLGFNHLSILTGTGNSNFQLLAHSLPSIYNGDVAIADIDNDGDNDIFQSGNSDVTPQSNLFLSNQSEVNTNNPPTVPFGLTATTSDHMVMLQWSPSTDDHTPTASLQYSIYIRDANGGLIVSPLAALESGQRRYHVRTSTVTHRFVHSLPEGSYSWSVQSIDAAGNSSGFTTEQTFSVCHKISLGNDTAVCQNASIILSRAEPDSEVQWYSVSDGLLLDASNEITRVIDERDTIVVQVHKSFGCMSTDTLIIDELDLPVVALGNDQAICEGDTFSISLSESEKIDWYRDGELVGQDQATFQFLVQSSAEVVVQVEDNNHCINRDTIAVTLKTKPTFSAGPDRNVCPNAQVLLELTDEWSSVKWIDNNTQQLLGEEDMVEITAGHPRAIVAEIMSSNGCTKSDTVAISLFTSPEISLGSDQSICFGENAVIQATTSPGSIAWFDVNGSQLQTGQPSYSFQSFSNTTIIGQIIDNHGCANRDSVGISILSLPQFDLGQDTSLCLNEEILLTTGPGLKAVQWFSSASENGIVSTDWFMTHTAQQTDTLIAIAEAHNGCINRDSIIIVAKPLPVFTLGQDRSVCELDTVSLVVNGDWKEVKYFIGNITVSNNAVFSFKLHESTTVTAVVTSHNGCTDDDVIEIQSQSLPRFDLGLPVAICAGDTLHLNAPFQAQSYEWRNANKDIISVSDTYSGIAENADTVSLTIVDYNQCVFTDECAVTINVNPEPLIDGPTDVCEGDRVKYTVPLELYTNAEWTDQELRPIGSTSVEFIALAPATYRVHVTDLQGCRGTQSISLNVWPKPQASAGADMLICEGQQIEIGTEEQDDMTYSWSPPEGLSNSTHPRPLASPGATTSYQLLVTTVHGCTDIDSVTVSVEQNLVIDAGTDRDICLGESLTLEGNVLPNDNPVQSEFNWVSLEENFNSNQLHPIVKPSVSAWYFLFATHGHCDMELDSVFVQVHEPPVVTVTADTSIGLSESIILSASGAASYTWHPQETLDNANIADPTASPLATTLYTVIGRDENGCLDTARVMVYVQNAIFIPSLFSPNGDQSNDVFKVYGSGFQKLTLSVYDDRGQRIFHTTDKVAATSTGWDGTYNGRSMVSGTYFWKITGSFVNGDPVHFQNQTSGIINLLR